MVRIGAFEARDGGIPETHPLKWGMPAEPIEVNVSGVKLVELVARSATTANEALPVTWGEAALTGS